MPRLHRRRSGGRPDPSADSRPAPARNSPPPPPPPREPGMENDEIVPNQLYDSNQPTAHDDRVPTHCYHLRGGDNEIHSIGGLKDFQIGSHLSSEILKDFQIAMSKRAIDARTSANSSNFPSYGRDKEERKTFISSGCNHLWQEKLYGFTRVAVYGVDSLCVVMRKKDFVELTPWRAFISEVEGLACPPGKSRQVYRKRNQKPFGVVSVSADTNRIHKLSGHKAQLELKAIKFLQEEMNSASTFTLFKTVKTAICALQHLFNKKFKPNKIKVFVWKKAVRKRENVFVVKELKIRDERSIKDILAVINNKPHNICRALVGSEGSPP